MPTTKTGPRGVVSGQRAVSCVGRLTFITSFRWTSEGGAGRGGGHCWLAFSPSFSLKIDLSFLMLWVGARPVSLARLQCTKCKLRQLGNKERKTVGVTTLGGR